MSTRSNSVYTQQIWFPPINLWSAPKKEEQMEHPLIGNINNLKEEQLSEKINELTKKYMIAQRSGNAHLCQQIAMALETYRNKLSEIYKASNKGDFDDKIDVT